MYRIYAFSVLLGLQLLCGDITFASEECVFDKNYYSEKTYTTNTDIKSVVWQDKYKVAKILTQKGDLIAVQHWACTHLGLQAIMLISNADMDNENAARGKVRGLVKMLVRQADFDEVIVALGKMKCLQDKECKINIPVKGYSEFYIQSDRQQESMTILLKYYLN